MQHGASHPSVDGNEPIQQRGLIMDVCTWSQLYRALQRWDCRRCLFHLKKPTLPGCACTYTPRQETVDPSTLWKRCREICVFVGLLGFFSAAVTFSSKVFATWGLWCCKILCLSHVRDVGGSTGTIKWPHSVVALLCFALLYPDQSVIGVTCIYYYCKFFCNPCVHFASVITTFHLWTSDSLFLTRAMSLWQTKAPVHHWQPWRRRVTVRLSVSVPLFV